MKNNKHGNKPLSARAIETMRPYAIDLASSVESEPGVKDIDKLAAFFEAFDRASGRTVAL